MNAYKELAVPAALLALALLLGLWLDAIGWCLLLATFVWIGIQAAEYRKVLSWSKRPLRRPLNGWDSWFALAYRPYRSLQRERERTRQMAGRLRGVLGLAEVIPDGVIITNANGDIVDMNVAARELLGLHKSDQGLGLGTLVRNPDFVSFAKSEQAEDPLEFVSPIDPERTYEARRIGTDNEGAVIIVRDITTLNRLLTMRQNFVANVSHELRTPLTVVAGYLETMTDPEQPEALRLSLGERLLKPMARMRSLVDDLLLLSQLESTPVVEEKDVVPLKPLIQGVVNELQSLSARPDQISVFCEGTPQVMAIETELHSVILNLLSNALRYSPDGGDVDVKCEAHDDRVRISVRDHGVGIAPEHMHRLTERFYRVDMVGARTRGGTGLGLAIVKHVLRRHDSQLQVESTLGSGSLFYFDIERADLDQGASIANHKD